jgi:hypothetical protein
MIEHEKLKIEQVEKEIDLVERFGVTRLQASRALADISRTDLQQLGDLKQNNNAREHVDQFMQQYFTQKPLYFPLYILSTNWSYDVVSSGIRSVTRTSLRVSRVSVEQVKTMPPLVDEPTVRILVNDLEFENDVSTGVMSQQCTTSVDKQDFVKAVLEATPKEDLTSFFIGDGLVDFASMRVVDHGILLKQEKNLPWLEYFLKQFPERIGTKSLPIEKVRSKEIEIYTAMSWKELLPLVSCEKAADNV